MKSKKVQINIKNIDENLKNRHQKIAEENGMTLNKYLINLLEKTDPIEQYKKLYEETTHQQSVNIKVMKEMVSKLDDIHKIMKQIEEE
ncbi:hypothetical protein [Staphylococcus haemolyticus]|uniref:hypothetical protein n=1 Tax=Staphylococcus haemolyticus TaxID=1283 RepID=UPI001D4908E8|nr:hypothetical protein [Staphylococcus haemolyticus]MBM6371506.1 hypothetical protein [Staphylococcus epidermidis]MCH4446450.1 hypothetical protein [Staphylococcus haemolyticus]